MAKTSNRLSQFNALETRSRLARIALPIKVSTKTINSWSIAQAAGGGSNVTLVFSDTYSPINSDVDKITISGISNNDINISFSSATTNNLSTTVSGLSGMSGATHTGWGIKGLGIPSGATIVSVTNATTVVISSPATLTQAASAYITISPYIFTSVDPDPTALNKTYLLNVSTLSFYTELEWSMGYLNSINTSALASLSYQDRWVVDQPGTENETSLVVSDFFDNKSRYAIQISPGGTAPVTVSLINQTQID